MLITMMLFETRKTIALLGINYPAQMWMNEAIFHTVQAIALVFVVLLLVIAYLIYIIVHNNAPDKTIEHLLQPPETDSLKANLIIERANNNFKSFFNTMNDMLFVLDIERKIICMNTTAYKRLDYTEDEIFGQSVLLLHPENRREEVNKTLLDMIEGKLKFCSIPVISKHGLIIPVETCIVMGEWNGEPALLGVVKDISEIKKSEEKFSKAFHSDTILRAISRMDDGCYIDVNDAFLKTFDFNREEVIGKRFSDLEIFNEDEQRKILQSPLEMNDCNHDYEVLIKDKNGMAQTYIFTANSIIMSEAPCLMITMVDITNRKLAEEALKESESQLIAAQLMADIGSWELFLETKTIWASIKAFNIFGIESDTRFLPIEVFHSCVFSEYHELLNTAFLNLMTKKDEYDVEFRIKNAKSGEERFIHAKAVLMVDESGKPSKVVGIIQDITVRKKKENEIINLSHHDQLTGLYNRRFYEEELKRLDTERNLPLSIVMGDVNGLKLINDSFGHAVGDELLKKVARVITKGCRTNDIIARLGGDEFVILLPKTDADETERIIERIQARALKEKIESIDLSISFGYEVKWNMRKKIQEVFKKAEDKMYKQKIFEGTSMRGKTINVIINALQEKDKREEQHSHRVSALCKSIGEALGLPANEIEVLKSVGLLHDIGKIGIDETILNKPGELTVDERKEIKRHPEIGYRILNTVDDMSDMANFILCHHESWNGKGYPKGLKGDEIPFVSRIITIADAYDAMTSERSYRSALPEAVAIAELQKNAGVQFDPDLVRVFINHVLRINR